MVAMVVVYAGAALATTVSEVEPNDAFAGAQNVDAYFSLDADPNITDSTTVPHATVDATGNGTLDFCSFTVLEAGMGTFDIDGAYPGFDSYLQLFDSNGVVLDASDDGRPVDAGSTELEGCVGDPQCGGFTRDSYLQYNFASAGTYYIRVSELPDTSIPAGKSYTLNVSIPRVIDNTAPKVSAATPTGTGTTGTGIGRGTTVAATFSEKMSPASITRSTFKLFKVTSSGTTQVTNVMVTLSSDGLKATLNPYGTSSTLLAARTKYKAVVTTGAKDLAGNALDQNSTTAGDQQKTWTFTIKG